MRKPKKGEEVKKVSGYEKPVFEKTEGLTFPEEIIQKFNSRGYSCLQCSACHGCA